VYPYILAKYTVLVIYVHARTAYFLHPFQNYASIVFAWAIMAAIYEWAAADPIDVRPIFMCASKYYKSY